MTVKLTGCEFDPHPRRWNIYLKLYCHFFALVSRKKARATLSSATQHAKPPEFGRKWGTQCLNTRFPLPTLLCAGYSVKLIWFFFSKNYFEAGRGAAAQGVTVKPTGCGFDPHSRRWNIYLNLYFHFFALVSRLSAALSSATQHTMSPEFGRKWGTECLNTRFPLPTLLCAGYSVKLIFNLFYILL